MAAVSNELREKGRIDGFGSMSSAVWEQEVREYNAKRSEEKSQDRPIGPKHT